MTRLIHKETALNAYNEAILNYVNNNDENLSIDRVIDISQELFTSLKIQDVDLSNKENDMLLCQYGVYNWGDDKGHHANFNITRQFQILGEDEFNQLSISLIYDHLTLDSIEDYNLWSVYVDSIDEWVSSIKNTPGYEKLKNADPRFYQLFLRTT